MPLSFRRTHQTGSYTARRGGRLVAYSKRHKLYFETCVTLHLLRQSGLTVSQDGYFMTKQPSQKELQDKISFATARQREVDFFENTWPWNNQMHLRERMGTPFLTKELSKLLGSVINKASVLKPCSLFLQLAADVICRLPDLRKEAKASYQEVEQQLMALPPPPSDDPYGELLRMLTSFSNEVNALVQGYESYERLLQKCRPAYTKLQRDIRGTAPRFTPFTHAEDSNGYCPDIAIEPESEPVEHVEIASMEDEVQSLVSIESETMNLGDVRKHIERYVYSLASLLTVS